MCRYSSSTFQMYILLENYDRNRSVRTKNFLPCIFKKFCSSKVRPKAGDVTYCVSCPLKSNTPPPKEKFASFHAMEHLRPVGQSDSGHGCTIWSLSCLKR